MHDKTVEEVLSLLKTSLDGISEDIAKKNIKIYGPNKLEIEEESLLKLITRQFTSPLIVILIVASFVALYFGEVKDFIFIFLVILINGGIGFYEEFKAKSKLKELLNLTVPKVEVVRSGKVVEISADQLTVGDIVILREGDIIPADIRLIESNNLLVDESILTGESLPVEKFSDMVFPTDTPIFERKNIGFAATAVNRGIAKGVVYAVGLNTEMGKIYSKTGLKDRKTPLSRAINTFSKRLLTIIAILLLAIFLLGVIQGRSIEKLLLLVIAQLVSAVPEGLPIAITIALVVGAVILHKRKVLIRQLPAVEALGSATFICTDKTGTITENKLTVNTVYSLKPQINHLVFALANDSDVERGDPLEIAMLKWLEEQKVDYISIRENNPRVWLYPFDTRLKLMASINKVNDEDFLFIKGAFESLEKLAINSEDIENLKNIHYKMAKSGLRVLAFGYTQIDRIPEDITSLKINLIGLIGFLDPPKQTAIQAVESAKKAGIKVIMITGDNLETSKTVAQMVKIYEEGKVVIEGKDLSKYTDEQLKDILKSASVIARATPEDKYRVVKILQKSGEEVVMIGDGVNDMPAVKLADLGIAMNDGSQATKSVAKMILIERDLSVIVDAIKIGRRISHNLRKVILYLVSTSMGEIILLFFAFLLALPQPLYATQILWINLITDSIQDKSLVLTREEKWIFSLKPQVFSKWFLDKFQLYRIFSFSLFFATVNIILFGYLITNNYPLDVATTIVFNSVVFSQWAHGIQAIREYPFFYNILENFKLNPYIFLLLIFLGIPIQFFGVYVLSDFIHCKPISVKDWIYPIAVFFLCFMFIEIRKWIEYRFLYRIT